MYTFVIINVIDTIILLHMLKYNLTFNKACICSPTRGGVAELFHDFSALIKITHLEVVQRMY